MTVSGHFSLGTASSLPVHLRRSFSNPKADCKNISASVKSVALRSIEPHSRIFQFPSPAARDFHPFSVLAGLSGIQGSCRLLPASVLCALQSVCQATPGAASSEAWWVLCTASASAPALRSPKQEREGAAPPSGEPSTAQVGAHPRLPRSFSLFWVSWWEAAGGGTTYPCCCCC